MVVVILLCFNQIRYLQLKLSDISFGIFCNFSNYPSYCDYGLSYKNLGINKRMYVPTIENALVPVVVEQSSRGERSFDIFHVFT